MRLSLERACLVGAVMLGGGLLGACANGAQDDYDAGYTAPVSTVKKKTSAPDATTPVNTGDDADQSSGDDQGSQAVDSGDDGGADATTDDGGDDSGDDASTGVTCSPGQTCVDMAPPGWTGYVQLRLALADAGTGSCALPYAAVQLAGVADPSGAPAQCTPCTCGKPTGSFACSASVGSLNLGCSGTDTITALPAGTCTNGGLLPNGATYAPTVTSGSGTCAGDGGVLIGTPDAAASTPAVVCALGAADGGALPALAADAGSVAPPTCDSTQACAAVISSQAGPSGVCIFQSGITTCPSGTVFTDQHIVGASVSDTRSCACSCAPATCPSDGYIEGFKASGCTGTVAVTLDAGSACGTGINGSTYFKYVASRSSSPGTCAPAADAGASGGVSVDTATGTTLCCIP
jgi:hypothetical protein